MKDRQCRLDVSLPYIKISRYLKYILNGGLDISRNRSVVIYLGIGAWIYLGMGAWIYEAAWPASKPAGFGG